MYSWQQGVLFLARQESQNVVFLFLTSGLIAFMCLWLLVLPNSKNEIIHVLLQLRWWTAGAGWPAHTPTSSSPRSQCIYLSFYLSTFSIYIYQTIHLSIFQVTMYLSILLSIHLFCLYLSNYPSIHLPGYNIFIYPSMYLSWLTNTYTNEFLSQVTIYLSIFLSFHLFYLYLSNYPSIHLPVHNIFIYPSMYLSWLTGTYTNEFLSQVTIYLSIYPSINSPFLSIYISNAVLTIY